MERKLKSSIFPSPPPFSSHPPLSSLVLITLLFPFPQQMETAKAWGEAIKTSKSLEILNLSFCNLAAEVFEALAAGFAKNTSVLNLTLDGNAKLGKTSLPAVRIFVFLPIVFPSRSGN